MKSMKKVKAVKDPKIQINKEKALVEVIINGSAAQKEVAFAELYSKYKPAVLQKMNIGVRYNNEVAKDLMMDVFTKVHMSIGLYKPEHGAFSTWLFTIATNRLIDYKRTEKYEVLSIEELNIKGGEDKDDMNFAFQIVDESRNNNGYDVVVGKERANIVSVALDAIKNDTVREVIKLRFFDDISYDEISQKMNIPVGSVKAYVNRGKSEMKDFMTKKSADFAY